MHVLVVDDSSVMRRIYQKALEGLGWQVTLAEDGQDALRRLPGMSSCELMVTDLHMPNLDGIGLIMGVRKGNHHARMKIILVTSDGLMETIEKATAAAADDVLIKPFTAADFASRLKGLTGG